MSYDIEGVGRCLIDKNDVQYITFLTEKILKCLSTSLQFDNIFMISCVSFIYLIELNQAPVILE